MNIEKTMEQLSEFTFKEDIQGYHVILNVTGDYMFTTDTAKKAIAIANALDKQISKKVIGSKSKVKAFDVETGHIYTYECSPCPSCEKWMSKNNKYCNMCGQKLDWDNKNE